MFVYIFVSFLTCVFIQFAGCNENIGQYLTKQSDFVSSSVKGPTEILGNGIAMKFYNPEPLFQGKTYKNASVFTIFDVVHILMDRDLYFLDDDYEVETLQKLYGAIDSPIAFVKATEYKNMAVVVFGLSNNLLQVYGKQRNKLRLQFFHSIAAKNCNGIHFFSQNDELYMILASEAGFGLEPSACVGTCVFKWTGVHFDRIYEAALLQGVGFATFPSSDGTVVVVLQRKMPSAAYIFNGHKLSKIQSLNTSNPSQAVSFKLEKMHYVVILDAPRYRTYLWTGTELLSLKTSRCPDIDKIYLHYTNGMPLLMGTKDTNLHIYKPTTTGKILQNITIDLHTNYTNTSAIMPIFQQEDYAILILQADPKTSAFVLPFELRFNSTFEDRQAEESGDDLLVCMRNLASLLSKYEDEKSSIKQKIERKMKAQFKNAAAKARTGSDTISVDFPKEHEEKLNDLHDYLQELRTAVFKIQRKILELSNEPIFGNATIKGNLIAKTLTVRFLQSVKNVNNVTEWDPPSWLSYSGHQIVTGPSFAKTVVVKNLITSPQISIFNNLLLRNGSHVLIGNSNFGSLKASTIVCSIINDIPFEMIYLRSQPREIKGLKVFDFLEAANVTTNVLNKKPPYEILNALSDPKFYHFKFGSHLSVQNLKFKEINGVNWEKLRKSVFRRGINSRISGNLKMTQLSVNHLKIKTIAGFKADDLFTATTNQTIKSIVHFESADIVKNLYCNNINGVDVERQAAIITPAHVTVVDTPVSIRNLKAYEKLYINTSNPGFPSNFSLTPEKEVLQIYHEKVKITGNVSVNKIFFDNLAKVTVNGKSFQIPDLQNYWLKNEIQVIPVHVTFQNGASVPHLVTSSLNGVNLDDYMVQGVDNAKPAQFFFENITVFGNVILNETGEHKPDLKAIDAGSVKNSGSYMIQGRTSFEGVVTVKHLKTSFLDNVDLNKAVTKDSNVKITGTKNFETVLVANNLKANSGVIKSINNKNLKILQAEALYVDEETSLPHVNFDKLIVQNLKVNSLNGRAMNDYVIKINRKQPKNTISSITFQGNVTINNATLGNINGFPARKIIARMLNSTVVVDHNVYLPGEVRIRNLMASRINGLNISSFSNRLLYRNYEQFVTAPFTFNTIRVDNLYTDKINNVSLSHLLRKEGTTDLVTNKNLTLNNVKYIKTLKAKSFSCDIERAVNALENSTKAKWKTVQITRNLNISNEKSKLLDLLKNVVTTNSDNNTILAPVIFEGHIFANTVQTAGIISGVNISKIAEDAIFSTVKGKQIKVTGRNFFHSIKAADVTVHGNAAIPVVNNFPVSLINSSIVHKNAKGVYHIKGKKTFLGGMEIKHLYTKTISGMKPENIVNLKNLKLIPNTTFDRLVVSGNLNVGKINDIDFEWFLKNRVLRKSDALQVLQGTYHFEKMILNDAVVTPHLNHLPVEDIVVDGVIQNIQSEKVFLGNVSTTGNVNVELINGLHINEYYKDSVLTGQDEMINGSLTIQSNSTLFADLNAETLNKVPIERLKYILNFHDPEIVAASAGNTLQKIGSIVERSLKNLRFLPDKFMYIQEVTTLRAALPPSQDSRVLPITENSSLVLLDGQISGTFCGLPAECPCPIEHSVYLSPGKIQINNNTQHRVFKYHEQDLFVGLSTKAVSVNSYCRTNYSKIFNEQSQLSWKDAKTGVKGFRKISGYVSDADFFTYNEWVYVIYCEYYDPVFDTHELFCTVLKSNQENNFEEIQKIPVKGAWKIHLLYTAQGIVLIIGNIVPGISNYTDIYRFNPTKNKFVFLREVKTIGCTSAAGVVLETESLIILAQPETPVHILKYDSHFDNYYYYQSFYMDHPVISLSVFYTGGFGISDAYLCTIMRNGDFNIYSFKEIEGWKLEVVGGFQGLTDLIPMEVSRMSYLFAPSSTHTKLLAIAKQSYV